LAQTFLSSVFPKKHFKKHFEHVINEMRYEAHELDAEGRPWKRRWIVLVYHLDLALCFASFVVFSVLKRIKSIWTAI
jgi:hypothetical protein